MIPEYPDPRPFLAALTMVAAALASPDAARAQELFAPGVISDSTAGDTWISFTPDGDTIYFSRFTNDFDGQTVLVTHRNASGWSAPQPAAFSGGEWGDRAARVSPDGRRLVFSSNRTVVGSRTRRGSVWNLWLVERTPAGAWGDPTPLPPNVNSAWNEYHASFTADGALYFASAGRPGGLGRSDVYRIAPRDGGWSDPVHQGPVLNGETSEPDLYVDPAERYMILVVTDREGGFGGDDLWVSQRTEAGWTEPRNLGPAVNTPEYEYGPHISPDGRWLYFTSHRTGNGDIYRVPLTELGLDQPAPPSPGDRLP